MQSNYLIVDKRILPDYVKSWEASLYRFAERLPDGLQSSAEDAIKSFSDKLLLSSEERAFPCWENRLFSCLSLGSCAMSVLMSVRIQRLLKS